MLEHIHAGEQLVQVIGDEILERDETEQVPLVIGQLDEPGKHRWDLEPGELLLAGLRAAHPHRKVQGESRDVRERVRRIDRERHEHGEDLGGEDLVQRQPVGLAEIGPRLDPDARLGHRRADQLLECGGVAILQFVRHGADIGENVGWGASDVGRHRKTGEEAPLQARDPHHEELVEVAGENGQEVGSLQHGDLRIFPEFEHPLVEREPAQLTVEEAVLRQAAVVDPGRLVVVVEGVGDQTGVVEKGLAVHGFIMALGGERWLRYRLRFPDHQDHDDQQQHG